MGRTGTTVNDDLSGSNSETHRNAEPTTTVDASRAFQGAHDFVVFNPIMYNITRPEDERIG